MSSPKKAGFSVRNPIKDASLLIAAGVYPGITAINKFGHNGAVASASTEELWDGSAAYSFPATALMTSLSQTTDQAALRGETVEVQGLDANWDLVTQNAVLDATLTTNVVTLVTPLIRVFRAKVLSSVVATSTIRVHNAGETQDYAVISAGNQQTQMAIYTVPAGHTAYLTAMWAVHNPTAGNNFTSNPIKLWARDNANGYAAMNRHETGVPEDGQFQHSWAPYKNDFGEKTDIYLTSSPVGAAADISGGFDLVLIDNDILG